MLKLSYILIHVFTINSMFVIMNDHERLVGYICHINETPKLSEYKYISKLKTYRDIMVLFRALLSITARQVFTNCNFATDAQIKFIFYTDKMEQAYSF